MTPPVKKNPMIADQSVSRNEAIRTLQFYLLWGILFINVTAGIGILAQASPMMQDMFGRTPLEAGVVVSLISLFNAGGRFMWASGSDYIGRRNTYTIFFVVQFFLFLLMIWAVGKASNAKDPLVVHKELTSKATSVQNQVNSDQVSDTAKTDAELPAWVKGDLPFNIVPVEAFLLTNPQFDPIAKPDTKKENPHVFPIGTYQVDLIRGSMRGFDIVPGADGEQMIAVIYNKKVEAQDQKKLNDLRDRNTIRIGQRLKVAS